MDQDDHRDLHGDDEACTWSSSMEQQCLSVVQPSWATAVHQELCMLLSFVSSS